MKKVKFIYNPYSGENTIIQNIDKIIDIHQQHDLTIVPYRISLNCEMDKALEDFDDTYKYVLVAGGDGTVDKVVNSMKERNIDAPLGILPVGTANDFATFIGMPKDIGKCCTRILESTEEAVDLGKINDKYFINVASTGLFTDVSQKTDINMKNTMGKLAYYLKGIEQVPNFRNLKVKVSSKEVSYDGDMYLMLIFNGQTAGNMNLAYKAKVDDGLLDVIIIKAIMVKDMLPLFIKILKTEHLSDQNSIIYFKTNHVEIECHEDIVTDIDGERGPDFPISIDCIRGGLKILGRK